MTTTDDTPTAGDDGNVAKSGIGDVSFLTSTRQQEKKQNPVIPPDKIRPANNSSDRISELLASKSHHEKQKDEKHVFPKPQDVQEKQIARAGTSYASSSNATPAVNRISQALKTSDRSPASLQSKASTTNEPPPTKTSKKNKAYLFKPASSSLSSDQDQHTEIPLNQKREAGEGKGQLPLFNAIRSLGAAAVTGGTKNSSNGLLSSNTVDVEEPEETVDKRRIYLSLRDAVRYSNGVSAVEVWIYDEPESKLLQPDGGWYRDPLFPKTVALDRLEGKKRHDHVPADPLAPGTGLAGVLWAEAASTVFPSFSIMNLRSSLAHFQNATQSHGSTTIIRNIFRSAPVGRNQLVSLKAKSAAFFSFRKRYGDEEENIENNDDINDDDRAPPDNVSRSQSRIKWRALNSLSSNPDAPTSHRLCLMEEAGFGQAAGVTFDVRGHKGIVVYLAKSDVPDVNLLSLSNDSYLRSAADVIGAVTALTKPRQESIESKKQSSSLHQPHPPSTPPENNVNESQPLRKENVQNRCMRISERAKAVIKKCKGGDFPVSISMDNRQSLLTFFGVFTTLLILTRLSRRIATLTEGQYFIIIGPFGALMALQYSLTMAPASQPRNCIYGQFVSVTIALLFCYVPDSVFPTWFRAPLATATAVSAMTRLGITHPPAGAMCFVVAGGGYDFVFLSFVLVGNAVAIVTATLINNASMKRQYPIYWHFFDTSYFKVLIHGFAKCLKSSNNEQMENDEVGEKDISTESNAKKLVSA